MRKSGASWAAVCQETGLSKGTAQRTLHGLPKNHLRCVSATVPDSLRKRRVCVLLPGQGNELRRPNTAVGRF